MVINKSRRSICSLPLRTPFSRDPIKEDAEDPHNCSPNKNRGCVKKGAGAAGTNQRWKDQRLRQQHRQPSKHQSNQLLSTMESSWKLCAAGTESGFGASWSWEWMSMWMWIWMGTQLK